MLENLIIIAITAAFNGAVTLAVLRAEFRHMSARVDDTEERLDRLEKPFFEHPIKG